MSFRLHSIRRLGNRISITIPKDPDGYMGRECPESSCEGYFKVKPGTGLIGDHLPCVCPYCGHSAATDKFWTKEQIKYAKSVALRKVTDALSADLKSMEFNHRPKGPFGIGISMKFQPGRPVPIRHYRKKTLETQILCAGCALDYAVYGLFAFCPDCGTHNSLQILERNLELALKQATLAADVPDTELARHLIEDALENCVSAFDGFGRETCRVRAGASSDPAGCERVSFQNLPRVVKGLQKLFSIDLQAEIASIDWAIIHRAFMKRHLIAHRLGVIDQAYVDETGEPISLLGRRVNVVADEVRQASEIIGRIGQRLVALLPPPR
jgi:hypothetical protein